MWGGGGGGSIVGRLRGWKGLIGWRGGGGLNCRKAEGMEGAYSVEGGAQL